MIPVPRWSGWLAQASFSRMGRRAGGFGGRLAAGAAGTVAAHAGGGAAMHSRRRLRARLAQLAGGGVLSPRVVTPDAMSRLERDGVAPGAMVLAAWAAALMECDGAHLSALGPRRTSRKRDMAWALQLAQGLLPTSGCWLRQAWSRTTCPSGARRRPMTPSGGQVLGRMARRVDAAAAAGRADESGGGEQAAAEDARLPDGLLHLVIAAVPEPVPLGAAGLGRRDGARRGRGRCAGARAG